MKEAIERLIMMALSPIHNKLRNLIARGIVNLINDSGALQSLQITVLGEPLDNVDRIQNYGFTSVPHPGATDHIAVFPHGRSQGFVIVVDDRRYRLKPLAAGEVAVYDDLGQRIVLTRSGILVQAPAILFDAELSRFTGDVQIDGELHADETISTGGDVLADGDVVADTVSLQSHVHIGSPTAGTGPQSNTGAPVP